MAENFRILYKNWFDDDDATVSYSSAEAALPGANALNDLRTKVWRTTGCAEEWAKVILDQAEYIDGFGIAGHNFSAAATITVQANDEDSWTTPDFEEEFDAWESVIGYGQGWYGQYSYGGYIPAAQLPKYVTCIRFLTTHQKYQYWRIKVTDSLNSDGYLDFGRICLGYSFQPDRNYRTRAKIIPIDASKVTKSLGGSKFVDVRSPYMQLNLSLYAKDIEVLYSVVRIIQDYGIRSNVFICLEPDTPGGRLFRGLYGFFPEGKTAIPQFIEDVWDLTLKFEEAV